MQKNFPRNEVKIVISSEIAAYLADKFADADEIYQAELAEMEAEQDRFWNDADNYDRDYDYEYGRDYDDDPDYGQYDDYDPYDDYYDRESYYVADDFYTPRRDPKPEPDAGMSLGDILAKCLERA